MMDIAEKFLKLAVEAEARGFRVAGQVVDLLGRSERSIARIATAMERFADALERAHALQLRLVNEVGAKDERVT